MIRRRLFARLPLLLVLLLLGALVYVTPYLREALSLLATAVQEGYTGFHRQVNASVNRHFEQAETIARLKRQQEALTAALSRCRADAAAYRALRQSSAVADESNVTALPVRVLGYARLGDFQRLWLEPFRGFSPQHDSGLLYKGNAVGIVVPQNRRPLALLAGDSSCSFAVYVGSIRAPGIAVGKDARHMTVKYIPEWMRIGIGDRVETSGLDKIFPPGMPVGKVVEIKKMQGFKNAEIELFGDTLHPDFLWVVWRR